MLKPDLILNHYNVFNTTNIILHLPKQLDGTLFSRNVLFCKRLRLSDYYFYCSLFST